MLNRDIYDDLNQTAYAELIAAIASATGKEEESLVGQRFFYSAATGNVFLISDQGPRYVTNIGAATQADDDDPPAEYVGDTWDFDVQVSDGAVAADISGAELWLTLKRSIDDADGDAALQTSTTVPASDGAAMGNGRITVPSTLSETVPPATYVLTIQLKRPGDPPYVRTVYLGLFIARKRGADVTD